MSLLQFLFGSDHRSRTSPGRYEEATSEQQYDLVVGCIRGVRLHTGAQPRSLFELRDQFPDISYMTDPLARLGSALLEKSPLPLSEVKVRADLSSQDVRSLLKAQTADQFSLLLVTANGHEVDTQGISEKSLDRIRRGGGVVAISIPGAQVRHRIVQYVADSLAASARAKVQDTLSDTLGSPWPTPAPSPIAAH